jgi:hypothetical protein
MAINLLIPGKNRQQMVSEWWCLFYGSQNKSSPLFLPAPNFEIFFENGKFGRILCSQSNIQNVS